MLFNYSYISKIKIKDIQFIVIVLRVFVFEKPQESLKILILPKDSIL